MPLNGAAGGRPAELQGLERGGRHSARGGLGFREQRLRVDGGEITFNLEGGVLARPGPSMAQQPTGSSEEWVQGRNRR